MDLLSGITNLVQDVVHLAEDAAPFALMAAGVPPELAGPLADLGKKVVGDVVDQAIQQAGDQLKLPKFVTQEARDLIKQAIQGAQGPVDQGTAGQVSDQFGDQLSQAIDDKICEFKDALKQYMDKNKGADGSKGKVTDFRALVAQLAKVLQGEFQNLATKTDAANKALGVATSGKPEDAQKDAATRADQFQATQEVTAESKIFEMVSQMCKAALDGCAGALKTQSQALQG